MARGKSLVKAQSEAEALDLEAVVAAAPGPEMGSSEVGAVPTKKKAAAPAKKVSVLSQARAVLSKAFKEEGSDEVIVDENRYTQSMPHIKSGSVVLDFLIGGMPNALGVLPCPGLPRGRVINLYGMESSGKTTLCLQAAAEVCRAGGVVCYIDWEQAVDVAYAKKLGVPIDDPDQFLLVQPATFEKGLAILWTMVRAGVDLVIMDSVGSGATKAQWEKKTEDAHETGRVGAKSAQWSEFFPKLTAMMNRTNTCVIGISQLRAKINTGPGAAYGEQTSQQGGNAWKFYSSVRIKLSKISTEKTEKLDPLTNKKEAVPHSNVVEIRLDKCKVSSSQGRKGTIYIKLGEGIDNSRSIIEIAAARGVVKKSGTWLQWERSDGSSVRSQGAKGFAEELQTLPGAFEELHAATMASLAYAMKNAPEAAASPEVMEDDVVGEIDNILGGIAPGEKTADEVQGED